MQAWRPETRARFAQELLRLGEGRHHDPHSLLGLHPCYGQQRLLTLVPHAERVAVDGLGDLVRLEATDLFGLEGNLVLPPHYRLRWWDAHGHEFSQLDPYSFAPLVSDDDLWLFAAGRHQDAWRFLGAHPRQVDGVDGVVVRCDDGRWRFARRVIEEWPPRVPAPAA